MPPLKMILHIIRHIFYSFRADEHQIYNVRECGGCLTTFLKTHIRILCKSVDYCMVFAAHDRFKLISLALCIKVCDIFFSLRDKSFYIKFEPITLH